MPTVQITRKGFSNAARKVSRTADIINGSDGRVGIDIPRHVRRIRQVAWILCPFTSSRHHLTIQEIGWNSSLPLMDTREFSKPLKTCDITEYAEKYTLSQGRNPFYARKRWPEMGWAGSAHKHGRRVGVLSALLGQPFWFYTFDRTGKCLSFSNLDVLDNQGRLVIL